MVSNNVLITVVHANSVYTVRRILWDQIRVLKGPIPWVIVGDYNFALKYEEKKGGRPPTAIAMEEFQKVVEDSELVETKYIRGSYTWCNNK